MFYWGLFSGLETISGLARSYTRKGVKQALVVN